MVASALPLRGMTSIECRVQSFFEDVWNRGVLRIRRLKEIAAEPPSEMEEQCSLPIFQYLVFGKERSAAPEEPWFVRLDERELQKLKAGAPLVRTSTHAFYPELVGGWNVMNRVVDLSMFSFNSTALEEEWRHTMAEAASRRKQHEKLIELFLEHLQQPSLLPGVRAVAIRGQAGQTDRIPGADVDLLVFLEEEAYYRKLLDVALEFSKGSDSDVIAMTFLSTDFSEVNTHSLLRTASDRSGPRFDLYTTIGDKELVRVLFGDPVGSRWNLEVLKTCRPVLGERWFRDFVASYETAIGLRAKRSQLRGADVDVPLAVVTSRFELAEAHKAGALALVRHPPRIEMWSGAGPVRAFLSPLVAALLIEAMEDANALDGTTHRGAIDYLLATMEGGGQWRFAPHTFPEWPPDVDDTVCALAALVRLGRVELSGACLDRFRAQMAPSGLLRTWLVPKGAFPGRVNDPDLVVTANVALLMHRLGFGDDPLTIRMEHAILQHMEAQDVMPSWSLYYDRHAICAYFLARWSVTSQSPVAREVLARIEACIRAMDVRSLAVCELAAIICAAVWSGAEEVLTKALPLMLAFQQSSGMWPASPFFIDPGGGIYGSPEVTTALAIEAIGLSLPLYTTVYDPQSEEARVQREREHAHP